MSTPAPQSINYVQTGYLFPEMNGPRRGYANNSDFIQLVQHLQADDAEWKVEPLPDNVDAKTLKK
jgi:hypothetical protein